MAEKKLGGAGLRGQVAGETALCTVGKTGTGLTYRGYDISVLAEKARFAEVAFLLLKGHLPTQTELDGYCGKIESLRSLPQELKDVLERIPASAHPMDVMRTGCSMLGNLEIEKDFSEQDEVVDRLLAVFPSIICYWYMFSHERKRIDTALDDNSIVPISFTCLVERLLMSYLARLWMSHLFSTRSMNSTPQPSLPEFVRPPSRICTPV